MSAGATPESVRRAELLAGADTVVFLCSGNVVRSAFAELYARHIGLALPVRSGATVYRNERMFEEAVAALRERGVSSAAIDQFRPAHVDRFVPALGGSPIFLGMRMGHIDALAPWPAARSRAVLLGDLCGDGEILDPVLEGADFGRTFARVADCVERLAVEVAELAH